MEGAKIEYILRYFGNLMNEQEKQALWHYSTNYKLENSLNNDPSSIASRRKKYLKKGWLSEDAQVLALLKDGIDNFRGNTAQRILKEHLEEVYFNNCPKCAKLAKTPEAKQCRFCGYDWH